MEETAKVERRRGTGPRLYILPVFFLLIVAGLVGFGVWSYKNYVEAKKEILRLSTLEGQQELAKKEVNEILQQLSRHMILPQGEEPTVAIVTDVDALKKNQPFFSQAQNGDRLIVYSGAKKAIIYSPARDVVVNVGALVINEGSPEVAGTSIKESQAELTKEPSPSPEGKE